MYLVHTSTLKLQDFTSAPPYAILSHTWATSGELTYQDMLVFNSIRTLETQGAAKVINACKRAASDGFEYIWIDTCCIDKRSSAELSEAINSMFRWYAEAQVCYTYLDDVQERNHKRFSGTEDTEAARDDIGSRWAIEFFDARWHKRGWTLQELLAPPYVIFLNQNWEELGTRTSLADHISQATGIKSSYLHDFRKDSTVALIMHWASHRKTARPEDQAYSLLGLFGINMPLLYGEGSKAFIRLQHEILRRHSDDSIFVWTQRL